MWLLLLLLLLVLGAHAFQDVMAVQDKISQTHAMLPLVICTTHDWLKLDASGLLLLKHYLDGLQLEHS